MTKDKNGKLTYEMKSPGEAWNDFVNSKEGHNAMAVTPSYLSPQEPQKRDSGENKDQEKRKPALYYEAMKSKESGEKNKTKELEKDVDQEKGK